MKQNVIFSPQRVATWCCCAFLLGLFPCSSIHAQNATVSGRVVSNEHASDLGGAVVTLQTLVQFSPGGSLEAAHTYTQNDGSFSLSAPSGFYVLQVEGKGLLKSQWGSLAPGLAGQSLVLKSGEVRTGITVSVEPHPKLCGQVLGVDGNPVAHANVSAWMTDAKGVSSTQTAYGENSIGGNIIADENGHFSFDTLHLGFYLLSATFPARTDINAFGSYGEDSSHPKGVPIHLAIHSNDTCKYSIRLHDPPKPYNGPRFHISGTLDKTARAPDQKNLFWELSRLDRNWLIMKDQTTLVPFDPASPSFSFAGVAPGRYTITLVSDPLETISGPCVSLERVWASTELSVSRDLTGIVVPIKVLANLEGDVHELHNGDDVALPRSSTARYSISLSAQTDTDWRLTEGPYCQNAITDASGHFTISDLTPGEYEIVASISELGEYTFSVLDGRSIPVPDSILHLHAGENAVEIDTRFDSGRLFATINAESADGFPARDANNNWTGGDEHVVLFSPTGHFVSPFADAEGGRFKEYLPPGQYLALAMRSEKLARLLSEDHWSKTDLEKLTAFAVPVEIKAAQTTVVTLDDRTVDIQNLCAALGLSILNQ